MRPSTGEDEVVIEEHIKGREFSVGVMEDQVLYCRDCLIRDSMTSKNKYASGICG